MHFAIPAVVLNVHGVAPRDLDRLSSLFTLFRDAHLNPDQTKKTGFSRQQRRRVGIQPVNIGPVAKNLTMTKRFFRLRRSRRVQAPVSGIIGFVNRQFMMIRHAQSRFLIEAFDREQWCPVLQAMLAVDDPEVLRAILGEVADEDPELQWIYHLDDEELAAIVATFNVSVDAALLDSKNLDIILLRYDGIDQTPPYLAHTRYELPLLLDGRKKLARMVDLYPPMTFEGEDRFDHWVAKGMLHREEVSEPFDPPIEPRGQTYLGHRTVYYTPKGEEWRIPASKLIWDASGKAGGWNEYFERLEGMLFGYEDWQNDWWIKQGDDRWWLRRPVMLLRGDRDRAGMDRNRRISCVAAHRSSGADHHDVRPGEGD
jgi:hypothetical protein